MSKYEILYFCLLAVLIFVACTKPDRSEEADRVTDELEKEFAEEDRELEMAETTW